MKRLLIITLILISTFNYSFCQKDTVIYYGANNKPADKASASRYLDIKKVKKNKYEISTFDKREGAWVKSQTDETVILKNDSTLLIKTVYKNKYKNEYLRKFKKVNDLYLFQDFYKSGKIKQEGISKSTFPLYFEGELKTYFENGNNKSIEVYKDNQMISNKNWLENGERYIDNIFQPDTLPEFSGGLDSFRKIIQNNLRYPNIAAENGISGRVFVGFVVDQNGEITGVHIERGVDPALDKEAVRVVESISETWTPGRLDGQFVNVRFTFPVVFILTRR